MPGQSPPRKSHGDNRTKPNREDRLCDEPVRFWNVGDLEVSDEGKTQGSELANDREPRPEGEGYPILIASKDEGAQVVD